MCNKECLDRFQRMELKINQISTDMKWFKWLIRTAIIGIGAFFGLDISGMI